MPSTDHQPVDSLVHRAVLLGYLQDGHAPDAATLAARLSAPLTDIHASLNRLHANHGLVLHPGSHQVWLAHPFSSSPTLFYVEPAPPRDSSATAAPAPGWWAPCIWCACGVAALAAPADSASHGVRIHTRLAAERRPVVIDLRGDTIRSDAHPGAAGLLAHFPIPLARAWDNVHHFCASTLVFDSSQAIDAWCARHGYPRGDAVPLAALWRFARAWYGHHLAADWRKPTADEARAIIEGAGFTGPTWEIPGGRGRF